MSYSNPNQLNDIIQRPYAVDISQFLSRGWQIFTKNAWGFIGFFFLHALISVGLSKLEVIGLIANGIISGVLAAGYFFVSFKIAKGSQTEFGDFFKGFKNTYFLHLLLVNLVQNIFGGFLSLVSMASFGLLFYNFFRAMFPFSSGTDFGEGNQLPNLPELPIQPILTPVLLMLGLLSLFSAIYLAVSYTFAIPLIVDKKIGFWKEGKLVQTLESEIANPISQPSLAGPGIKIWSVIIGVASYKDMPTLRFTDDDAYRIYAFLKSPEGGAVADEQIKLLIDEAATRQNILNAMREVFYKAGPNDFVLLYFSGHGLPGALLPIDYNGVDNKIFHQEINDMLKKSPAKKFSQKNKTSV